MKKLIALFLSLLLFASCAAPASAKDFYDAEDEESISDFDETYYDNSEEKVICTATLDDEFAPDKVLVVMSHDVSMEFKSYTIDSFPELELAEVRNLSSSITKEYNRCVAMYLEQANPYLSDEAKQTYAEQMAKEQVSITYPRYRLILLLTLKTSNKAAVLDAVRTLEKRGDVYAAGPDYISLVSQDQLIDDTSTEVLSGDADRDGDVTILDATRIQLYKAELIEEYEIDLIASDFDGDSFVTILDATRIRKTLADSE